MYRPPPKPVEIQLQEIPRKLADVDTNINMDFEENSPYQEERHTRNLIDLIFRSHQNWIA